MATNRDLLEAFELHDVEAIRAAFSAGVSPVAPIDGKVPIVWLWEMYTRSPRFPSCVRALLDAGADLGDPLLLALLLDDVVALRTLLDASPNEVERVFHLECAYTSLAGVTPLHVCAEYNSVACAHLLLESGADVDARAHLDEDGLGGHTPLFHTVNSNGNHGRPMMELLLARGAAGDVRTRGLVWGGGCPWETALFDVTPLSYAQCGLLPQFHRKEEHIASNVQRLHEHLHGVPAPLRNVPNRYLTRR